MKKLTASIFVLVLPFCLMAEITIGKSTAEDIVSAYGAATDWKGPAGNLTSSEHKSGSNFYQVKYKENKVASLTIWGPSKRQAVSRLLSSNSHLEFGPERIERYYRNRFDPKTGKQERQRRTLKEYVSEDEEYVLRSTIGDGSKNIGYIYIGPNKHFSKD